MVFSQISSECEPTEPRIFRRVLGEVCSWHNSCDCVADPDQFKSNVWKLLRQDQEKSLGIKQLVSEVMDLKTQIKDQANTLVRYKQLSASFEEKWIQEQDRNVKLQGRLDRYLMVPLLKREEEQQNFETQRLEFRETAANLHTELSTYKALLGEKENIISELGARLRDTELVDATTTTDFSLPESKEPILFCSCEMSLNSRLAELDTKNELLEALLVKLNSVNAETLGELEKYRSENIDLKYRLFSLQNPESGM